MPIDRVFRIHHMIVAQRFPNCTTLARELEVDRKTILRDISWMRDERGMPLEYHQVEHGYYYTKPVKDFPLMRLTRQDLLALFLARKALEPLRGTRLQTILAESFEKLAEMCAGEVSFRWQDLDDAFSVRSAGVVAADMTLFGDLVDAVLERREIAFDYVKLNATQIERRTVRPYHVGQFENGWYLIAHDMKRDDWRTFALQRITQLKVLRSKFVRQADFDVRSHFGGSFGVWAYDGDLKPHHEVCIRFEGYAARIVSERRWHPTQEIVNLEGRRSIVELRMRLAGLEEVTRWVLSWGSKAEVVAPPALAESVRKEVEALSGRLQRR
jgi:proteasome accessory factor B